MNCQSLPPDREVEFAIGLAPGTEPVSEVPYRMASGNERVSHAMARSLKEGVIRPSTTP